MLARSASKIYQIGSRCCSTGTSLTKVSYQNGIQTITLNNPKTRNSLSLEMLKTLICDLEKYKEDKQLRVILLTAEGTVFSAGHNLKELASESGDTKQVEVFDTCTVLMKAMIDSPVPIIARVDGLAAAAGCQLVAQCDIAVCSEKSSFSTPGSSFGIFCSTPGIPLSRCVPKMTAMHMLLTGHAIKAQEAYAKGLVSKVVSGDKLDDEVSDICDAIKSKSRAVVELGKRFYYRQVEMGVKSAYELGGPVMVENIRMSDGQEGIRSFMEKRKPKWTS